MSTFDGLIREFPSIAIDNFKLRPGVNVYLLSHVHSDHLSGLAAKNWSSLIYCSQITAKWIPMLASRSSQTAFENGQSSTLERRYAHLSRYLRPLEVDIPNYLDLGNGRKVRCTLLPAHHCPGAVMFLLQDDRSCILYTGDARNEAVDLAALKAMKMFGFGAPQIDQLYLDTTCCHVAFKEFPSREIAISDLVTFINHRPRLAHYYIDAWTFGYEDIWIALSKAFQSKVHVSPYLYELYKAIDDMIEPKILPHLTLDGRSARFHSCRLGPTCGYGGAGGEHSSSRELIRIQPNVSWFSEVLRKERVQELETEREKQRFFQRGRVVGRSSSYFVRERLPPCISRRDDFCYYINYACHASLSELCQLVELVSPRSLFPCVLHRDPVFRTLFESNRVIMALLKQHMHASIEFSKESENKVTCLHDVISTDFQSFHKLKGFQVLDMNDVVQNGGRTIQKESEDLPDRDLTRKVIKAFTSPTLSPRSSHLRKKLKLLQRQLRNSTSLDVDGSVEDDKGSSLGDGPLSLDFEDIERKRKWWTQASRGQSTTQEDIEHDSELNTWGSIDTGQAMASVSQRLVLKNNEGSKCIESDTLLSFKHKESDLSTSSNNSVIFDKTTLELPTNFQEELDRSRSQGKVSEELHFLRAPPSSIEYLSSSPDPVSQVDTTEDPLSSVTPSSLGALPPKSTLDSNKEDGEIAQSYANVHSMIVTPVLLGFGSSPALSSTRLSSIDYNGNTIDSSKSITTGVAAPWKPIGSDVSNHADDVEPIVGFLSLEDLTAHAFLPSQTPPPLELCLSQSRVIPGTPPHQVTGEPITLGDNPSKTNRPNLKCAKQTGTKVPAQLGRRMSRELRPGPKDSIFARLAWSPPSLRPIGRTSTRLSAGATLAQGQSRRREQTQKALVEDGEAEWKVPMKTLTIIRNSQGQEVIVVESSDSEPEESIGEGRRGRG